MPLIASRNNLRFWLFLIGAAADDAEAGRLLAGFPENSKDLPAVRAWNERLARKVSRVPGVGQGLGFLAVELGGLPARGLLVADSIITPAPCACAHPRARNCC